MNQIIFIKWWEAFYNDEQYYSFLKKKEYNPYKTRKRWRNWIISELSNDYESIIPDMPAANYAKYKAWKIWFEKLFPYLTKDKLILIWSSLWWTFLVKYLSENSLPREIDELHLVAPSISDEWLVDEYICDFKTEESNIWNIEKKAKKVNLYFSENDPVVPFAHCWEYKKLLKNSKFFIFKDRWHFTVETFPELLEEINK